MAFQKVNDRDRDGVADRRRARPSPDKAADTPTLRPRSPAGTRRGRMTKQVLFYYQGGDIDPSDPGVDGFGAVGRGRGGVPGLYSGHQRGRVRDQPEVPDWRRDRSGRSHKPMYSTAASPSRLYLGAALPASHGCVRRPLHNQDWLTTRPQRVPGLRLRQEPRRRDRTPPEPTRPRPTTMTPRSSRPPQRCHQQRRPSQSRQPRKPVRRPRAVDAAPSRHVFESRPSPTSAARRCARPR